MRCTSAQAIDLGISASGSAWGYQHSDSNLGTGVVPDASNARTPVARNTNSRWHSYPIFDCARSRMRLGSLAKAPPTEPGRSVSSKSPDHEDRADTDPKSRV